MDAQLLSSAISTTVALLALVLTTFLLARQVRQMEHERNALAILEAIERLTDPRVVTIFERLRDVNQRYPSDADIAARYVGSQDDRDFQIVAQYVETIACLSRRRVLDASLLVDAVGLALRRRWDSIRTFVERRRRVENNEYILENFEWLAMYSAWWKDVPRPARDRNYAPGQFAGVTFRV
ncbi:MAG TPA: hypothetical protein VFA29_06520 [Candidatus Baltobacteraceae bacterium]|nr:hypothetical protein [Candidatus Baltobacteraceae bacterium]